LMFTGSVPFKKKELIFLQVARMNSARY